MKGMDIHNNILETIGNTPLVRLNKVAQHLPCTVLVKIESFNPGHSIKDRIGLKMIEDAERAGNIKPGGTVIECTSGNTGMGIALASIIKGYHCIFTTSDKQSKEKFDMLKAMGAEVIVCPTNVAPEDPKSYYSVAERLSKEIANSFWVNQYENLSNRATHYESTGPEIWTQTDGKITHFVAGVGTGGTISGTGRYLKEKNPDVKVWGIDTYGSVFKKYHETGVFDKEEIYPYITEGIGEDILPSNVDFEVIDLFEKVGDKEGALMSRRLAREEGMLVGYSCGSAVAGLLQLGKHLTKDDLVVVVLPDHGSRYVGKLYNDDWMRERGFLDDDLRIRDLLRMKTTKKLMSISSDQTVRNCLMLMKENDLSQLPVVDGDNQVGSITESQVLSHFLDAGPNGNDRLVGEVMGDPFPLVNEELPCSKLSQYINKRVPAVMVQTRAGVMDIVTQYDLVHAL